MTVGRSTQVTVGEREMGSGTVEGGPCCPSAGSKQLDADMRGV